MKLGLNKKWLGLEWRNLGQVRGKLLELVNKGMKTQFPQIA
jgi:hypothetical protein